MFSYMEDPLQISDSKVRERQECIAEAEIEWKTLSAFSRTVRLAVPSRLVKKDMTCFWGECGVLTRVSQGVVQIEFDMCIFYVLHRMQCTQILSLFMATRLAEAGPDLIGFEWFLFDYEQSRFILISPVSGVTPRPAYGTEVTVGSHNEDHPIYR